MDIKVAGINREILSDALAQAKRGRAFILGKMLETISEPAADLSPYAPRVKIIKIEVEKIREVIGPGGKMVNKIIDETGVQIDIHEDGNVFVTSPDLESIEKAIKMIENIVHEVTVGEVYNGTVMRIINIGAFVELLPGKEALCHISQLDRKRVERVEDVVKIGDKLEVKVTEIDDKGRINVSHSALLAPIEGEEQGRPSFNRGSGDRGGRSSGGAPRGDRGGRPSSGNRSSGGGSFSNRLADKFNRSEHGDGRRGGSGNRNRK